MYNRPCARAQYYKPVDALLLSAKKLIYARRIQNSITCTHYSTFFNLKSYEGKIKTTRARNYPHLRRKITLHSSLSHQITLPFNHLGTSITGKNTREFPGFSREARSTSVTLCLSLPLSAERSKPFSSSRQKKKSRRRMPSTYIYR